MALAAFDTPIGAAVLGWIVAAATGLVAVGLLAAAACREGAVWPRGIMLSAVMLLWPAVGLLVSRSDILHYASSLGCGLTAVLGIANIVFFVLVGRTIGHRGPG